jgi:tRNA(adenine34) deaminase
MDVLAEPRFNHRPAVAGGLLREECAALLVDFFASRR